MEKDYKQKQQGNLFVFKPNNLTHVPLYKYEKDFTFIVNGEKFETSRIVADLLSPKISQLHFINESIKEIELNTVGKGDFMSIIKTIENQKKSKKTDNEDNSENGNKEEIRFIWEILKILGNRSFNGLHLNNEEETIEISNVFERIEEKIYFGDNIEMVSTDDHADRNIETEAKEYQGMKSYSRKWIESEVDFISIHFHEIEKEKIKRLKVEIIEDIIRNPKLKIEDEDSLLSLLIELYEEDNKISFLFEYVKYENVSEEKMNRFLEIFHIEDINYGIWESVSTRIINLPKNKKENLKERYLINKDTCSDKPSLKEFRGVIYHLTKEAGGNIHDKGIVNITSSSVCNTKPDYQPKNIVDFNVYKFFYSAKNPDEWICIDFKDNVIEATHYSIRSQWQYGENNCHLRSWVIEASNDKENWEIIDQRENCSELNGCGKVGTFEIEKKQQYRFIRLKQTGPNWSNNNYILFNAIEFYGKIYKKF